MFFYVSWCQCVELENFTQYSENTQLKNQFYKYSEHQQVSILRVFFNIDIF